VDRSVDLLGFCDTLGLTLYPWQREAFGEACRRISGRFVYRLAGISVPRGNGKSFAGAIVGLWRLTCGPDGQDIISAALDLDGAKVVLHHARRIVRQHPVLAQAVDVQAGALLVPSTGSRWTITSREHTASRGRHPDLVIYDEVGWAADDELFSSLLAGQASVDDAFCIVISTVGRRQAGPLWQVKQLAEGGDDSTFWWHRSDNLSPKVTKAFLERQRRILMPAQFAREHQNTWVDAADAFTIAAEVDAAMGHGWTEQIEGRSGTEYVAFVDLGAVHDPTVIAVGHVEDGVAYIDRLVTYQGSREEPVQLASVETALRDLAERFALRKIRIESWQGLSAVQALTRAGLPAEVFTPTAKAHAEEWPVLAQRLTTRTLVLPPHARLREELLNLVVEVTAQGVRVVDRGRIHQDHAVAVRGVVASLAAGVDGIVGGSQPRGPRWSDTLEEYVWPLRDALRRERWG
jgi:phage terminase large subunit-like protein